MRKYLYFRAIAALANDDSSADSVLIPAERLTGMYPTSDTALAMIFQSINPFLSDGQDGNFANNERIVLTVATNTHKIVMREIIKEIEFGRNPFITVYDTCADEFRTGGQNAQTLHHYIEGCSAPSLQAIFS